MLPASPRQPSSSPDNPSLGGTYQCWALATGITGLDNQAQGLAEAVGYPVERKFVSLHAPWRWLPGNLCPYPLRLLTAQSDPLVPPWPDLLITCGQRTVALSLAIKRLSGGRTTTVHIQAPHVPLRHFDLVAPLMHDRVEGPNVIATRLAIHHVTDQKLQAVARRLPHRFAALPRPLLAVLFGGPNGCYDMTAGITRHVCRQILALVQEHGVGVIVTTSRRTGKANERVIRETLRHPNIEVWDGEGENPYLAMLALADGLIVTCDSVSMLSEACSTGKPVYVIELRGGSRRFRDFQTRLYRMNLTRPFTGQWEAWSPAPPPRETEAVAQRVRQLVQQQQAVQTLPLRVSLGSETVLRPCA